MKIKTLKAIVIILVSFFFLSSCSKRDEPKPEEYIGPISKSEFYSVSPPTFEQIIEAYSELTQNNPSLLQNNEAFTKAIFEWVKSHPVEVSDNLSGLFTEGYKLTWEEWKVIIANRSITEALKASETVAPSLNTAKNQFPCDIDFGFHNSKADAFRHAYWNALMVRRVSEEFAASFATAHEANSSDAKETAMDLHNNEFGRYIALKYPTATDEQIVELLTQQKYVYTDDPVAYFGQVGHLKELVYFQGNRILDGTFLGTLTNPPGADWDITLDINQCGSQVNGKYAIVRGNETQERRFSGTYQGANLTLMVSEPYSFENPTGGGFCENVIFTLSGNANSLSGPWKSSNCPSGTVALAR